LSQRGLNLLTLAYIGWTAGSINSLNKLGQYASIPVNRTYCQAKLDVSLSVAVTINS